MLNLTAEAFSASYLSKRPLATDSFEYGSHRESKTSALKKRFIESCPNSMRNLMVLDFDMDQAEWQIKDLVGEEIIPEPSYVTTNPGTEHSQAGYFIEGFASSPKAVFMFNKVREGLSAVSGADLAYQGRMMRNPLSSWQNTVWGTSEVYSMKAIHDDFLDGKVGKIQRPVNYDYESGIGRNVDTFEVIRKFAYREFKKHEEVGTFYASILFEAQAFNLSFGESLPQSEIKAIARSIAKWVWKNFSKDFTFDSEVQRERVNKRWAASAEERLSKKEGVQALLEAGCTISEIVEQFGGSYEAMKKFIQRMK